MQEALLLELQKLGQVHQRLVQGLQKLGLQEMLHQRDYWLVLVVAVVVAHQS